MKRMSGLVFGWFVLGLMQQPACAQTKKDDVYVPPSKPAASTAPPVVMAIPKPGPSFRHLDGQRILFVANGVDNSTRLSDGLLEINSDDHLGLRIQMVPWTRTLSLFGDLTDREAQMRAAMGLTNLAQCVRRDCPHSPIYFLGHSAGAHVVLQAAAMMPEKSIDRVIVLHAAVSATYDLKPVFRATRYGVDNFYATQDTVLDAAVQHATTADGTKIPCAGRIAFRLPYDSPTEKATYCSNLRQHRWIEMMCGNGGHYAWTLLPNMRKCVVPLLFTIPSPPPTMVTIVPAPALIAPKTK